MSTGGSEQGAGSPCTLTEDLEPDVRCRPLVADPVVGLADVGAGLVAVHRLDDERLGPALLLAARQEVVLKRERYPQAFNSAVDIWNGRPMRH